MRIIPIILFILLKVIFIQTYCNIDCDSAEFNEVCAIRPNTDQEVVIKNKCLLDRQNCWHEEFKMEPYTFLHDGACKGWNSWTYEEVGSTPF